MSLYYLILWNQMDILKKHFKKDHVHMRLWTRFYGNGSLVIDYTFALFHPSKGWAKVTLSPTVSMRLTIAPHFSEMGYYLN